MTDAPVLLSTPQTALRRGLDRWLETKDLPPRVVAEFDNSALMKVFGQGGTAAFPAPIAIEAKIVQ